MTKQKLVKPPKGYQVIRTNGYWHWVSPEKEWGAEYPTELQAIYNAWTHYEQKEIDLLDKA